jgi:hypothetical protein
MAEITYQMVLSTLQTAGLLVGIFYYVMTLRNQRKNQELALETRQAQLFMNIYDRRVNNPEFDALQHKIGALRWKDWDEYQALFDYTNPETRDNHLAMSTIMYFYEGVGVLVKLNLVDIRLIAQLMGGGVLGFWEKVESIAEEAREHWYGPGFLVETEYLYHEMIKYKEEHPEFGTSSGDRRNRDQKRAHFMIREN